MAASCISSPGAAVRKNTVLVTDIPVQRVTIHTLQPDLVFTVQGHRDNCAALLLRLLGIGHIAVIVRINNALVAHGRIQELRAIAGAPHISRLPVAGMKLNFVVYAKDDGML